MKAINYPHDRQRLVGLLLAYRAATDVRLYPTIWRVLLLLTSRVWEPEKDARLWEDADGELVGFAMLWRRRPDSPYLVLDWFIRPERASNELVKAILEWGSLRSQEVAREQPAPLTLYTSSPPIAIAGNESVKRSTPPVVARSEATACPERSEGKQSLLDQFNISGFIPLAANSEEHNIYFARSLKGKIFPPELPTGYAVHRLQGVDDMAAYQSIYSFAKVNQEHQKELLNSEEYCCVVVIKPGGEFAAYCECSFWRAEWKQTGQRIGWIDYVETKETDRGKGLGRTALLAGLSQLQDWGAETAMLVTITSNTAAIGLYEKLGFTPVDVVEPAVYQKQVEP